MVRSPIVNIYTILPKWNIISIVNKLFERTKDMYGTHLIHYIQGRINAFHLQ